MFAKSKAENLILNPLIDHWSISSGWFNLHQYTQKHRLNKDSMRWWSIIKKVKLRKFSDWILTGSKWHFSSEDLKSIINNDGKPVFKTFLLKTFKILLKVRNRRNTKIFQNQPIRNGSITFSYWWFITNVEKRYQDIKSQQISSKNSTNNQPIINNHNGKAAI